MIHQQFTIIQVHQKHIDGKRLTEMSVTEQFFIESIKCFYTLDSQHNSLLTAFVKHKPTSPHRVPSVINFTVPVKRGNAKGPLSGPLE